MGGESTGVDAVQRVLADDEVIHWQETTRNYSYLPHVVGVVVAMVGVIVLAPLLAVVGVAGPVALVGGGFLASVPVGYLAYRFLRGPGGPHAYVATDRRVLAVPESAPEAARSIPWDQVDSMRITTDENGTSDGIAIATGDERLSPAVWGPLSEGVLISHPSGPVEDTFQRLLELRRDNDSFDPAAVDPARVGWSTSRDAPGEGSAADLDAGETVEWSAEPADRGFNAIVVLVAAFVAVHVYLGSFAFATSVLSLPSDLATVGSLVPVAGSVWAVRVAQLRLDDVEYLVTDERLIRAGGLRGNEEAVGWGAVTGVERSGNAIVVATASDPEAIRFERIPDLDEACRYLQYLRRQQS